MKVAQLEQVRDSGEIVAFLTRHMTADERGGYKVPSDCLRGRVIALRENRYVPTRGRGLGGKHARDGVRIEMLDAPGFMAHSRDYRESDHTVIVDPGRVVDTWEGYESRRAAERQAAEQHAALAARRRDELAQLTERAEAAARTLGARVLHVAGEAHVAFTVADAERLAERLNGNG